MYWAQNSFHKIKSCKKNYIDFFLDCILVTSSTVEMNFSGLLFVINSTTNSIIVAQLLLVNN